MSAGEDMNKAQRLALAAEVAPTLRSASERTKARKVTLYDPETGKVTGFTTVAKVQEALLLERKIELEVVDGVRPTEIVCQICGNLVKIGREGPLRKRCRVFCAPCATPGCDNKISRTNWIANGLQGRCNKCRISDVFLPYRPCARCGTDFKLKARGQKFCSAACCSKVNGRKNVESLAKARVALADVPSERRSEATRKGHAARRGKATQDAA